MSAAIRASCARRPGGEHADAGDEDHARQRIERVWRAPARRHAGREVGVVVARRSAASARLDRGRASASGSEADRAARDDQRLRLGADHVVGGERRAARQRGALRAFTQASASASSPRGAPLDDQAPARAVGVAGRLRQPAAEERRDAQAAIRRATAAGGSDGNPPRRRSAGGAPREPALGEVDELDVPLVALPRRLPPGEEAVLRGGRGRLAARRARRTTSARASRARSRASRRGRRPRRSP